MSGILVGLINSLLTFYNCCFEDYSFLYKQVANENDI